MAFRSLFNWWRTSAGRATLIALGVVALGVLFYRYMVHDGDFDVYWAATFRYLHGLKVHVQEQNVFTYPTFASFLLLPVYPLGYSAGKIIFFVVNVLMLVGGVIVCQRQVVGNSSVKTAALVVALFFSIRSILDVFNNQQTDLLIFGLVIFGLAFFTRVPVLGSAVMAIAAGLKANPLFMILLPVFKRRWTAAVLFIFVTVGCVVAPDLAKYSVSDLWTESEFTVPGSVMPKRDEIPQIQFRAEVHERGMLSYLTEHYRMTLSFSDDSVKWWQDPSNNLNQSLYRIVATHLNGAVPPNLILFGLCAIFGLALLWATRLRGDAIFVLGLLFYGAFVLIGPQSSKAHFIAFFGLLLYAWHNALENNSWLKSIVLGVLSVSFGIKAVGMLIPAGWLSRDFVGLSAFGIWLYSYLLFMISGHRR